MIILDVCAYIWIDRASLPKTHPPHPQHQKSTCVNVRRFYLLDVCILPHKRPVIPQRPLHRPHPSPSLFPLTSLLPYRARPRGPAAPARTPPPPPWASPPAAPTRSAPLLSPVVALGSSMHQKVVGMGGSLINWLVGWLVGSWVG